MLIAFALIALAYVMGSIPTGYWVAKAKNMDIRKHGSGSTGATNVWRCVGKAAGVFVFIVDVLKGYFPTLLAIYAPQFGYQCDLLPDKVLPTIVALVTMIGHSKSLFLNFSGGKSAATGLGTLFALHPLGALLTFITWLSIVFTVRIVSVASIVAVLLCGVYFAVLHAPLPYVLYCVVGFIYVTYRHKSNLVRLMKGTEPRIDDKPKELTESQQLPRQPVK